MEYHSWNAQNNDWLLDLRTNLYDQDLELLILMVSDSSGLSLSRYYFISISEKITIFPKLSSMIG